MGLHRSILVVSDILSENDSYAGRHRIEGFCKYWAKDGWTVHILTIGPKVPRRIEGCTYHFTNSTSFISRLCMQLRLYPSGIERSAVKSVSEFFGLYIKKIANRVLIPDRFIWWYSGAFREAKRIASKELPVFLFSSFYSATSHIVASRLSAYFGVPWIADYRDIWTDNVYHKSAPLYLVNQRQKARVIWAVEKRLEEQLLQRATCITTISQPLANILSQKVRGQVPVYVVPNGYDDDLICTMSPKPDKFRIVFTGRLNNSRDHRELKMFLMVLLELKKRAGHLGDKLVFEYTGGDKRIVEEEAKRMGVSSVVKAYEVCSYAESIKRQRASTLLLLMLPFDDQVSEGVASRKVFDYLAARRPIVGLVANSSAAANIITETGSGRLALDQSQLRWVLFDYWDEFISERKVSFLGRNEVLLNYRFSRLARNILSCMGGCDL